MRFAAFIIVLIVLTTNILSDPPKLKDYRDGYVYMPEAGFVSDEGTAIRIAEAVWLPIYGQEIYEELPFVAHLQDDTLWIVEGTLPKEYLLGGTVYAEILRADARIVRVTHFK